MVEPVCLNYLWNVRNAQEKTRESKLVGGWTNPFEKYDRQNGNLPQIGVKIKKIETTT